MEDYEKVLSDFIDGVEYENVSNAILNLVINAFKAGWALAGGKDKSNNEE